MKCVSENLRFKLLLNEKEKVKIQYLSYLRSFETSMDLIQLAYNLHISMNYQLCFYYDWILSMYHSPS